MRGRMSNDTITEDRQTQVVNVVHFVLTYVNTILHQPHSALFSALEVNLTAMCYISSRSTYFAYLQPCTQDQIQPTI